MTTAVQREPRFEFYECATGLDDQRTRSLEREEVHIWHAQVDDASCTDIARLAQVLSQDEKDRAGRFRFEKNRNEFIFNRATLRILLASYLRAAASELCFTYSSYGKPYLAAPESARALAFNLAHTEGMLVLAFAWERKIGVDIENIRKDLEVEEIAERFFSPAERRALRDAPPEDRHEAFFRCWTRKEAYIKARGEGLSHPLHEFDVSVIPQDTAALLATRPDPTEARRWLLRELPAGSGYIAALAVEADSADPYHYGY